MPFHEQINSFIKRFDHLGQSTKVSLFLIVVILGAIPVTVMALYSWNTLSTLAATSNVSSNSTSNQKPVFKDTQAPSVPVIQASLAHGSEAVVGWLSATDNVRVVGYEVLRTNGTTMVHLTPTDSNVLDDTSVQSGNVYTYEVRAFDAAGNRSAYSTPVTLDFTKAQQKKLFEITIPANTHENCQY